MQERNILDVVDLCYRSVEDPSTWQHVTRGLARLVEADAGDLAIERYDDGVAEALGSVGFDPAFRESYDDDFLGGNDWINELKRHPVGRTLPDHAEPPDFERRPYYNEWVKPQGFRYAIGAILEKGPHRLVHVGFVRNIDRSRFSSQDVDRLDTVLPHLHRAIRLAARLEAALAHGARSAALIGSLEAPAFIVNGACQVIDLNPKAESLLCGSPLFRARWGALSLTEPTAQRAFRAAVAVACSTEALAEDPARTEVIVPDLDGTGVPSVLDVVPLRSQYDSTLAPPSCLVLVTSPKTRLADPAGLLQRAFGMTPTEARIALAISNGVSVKDLAAQTRTSVGTVRWHVKSIEAKLGVTSLAEMVGMVSRLLGRV
jgi:DNA-binding CsgD family transcriptional regulator